MLKISVHILIQIVTVKIESRSEPPVEGIHFARQRDFRFCPLELPVVHDEQRRGRRIREKLTRSLSWQNLSQMSPTCSKNVRVDPWVNTKIYRKQDLNFHFLPWRYLRPFADTCERAADFSQFLCRPYGTNFLVGEKLKEELLVFLHSYQYFSCRPYLVEFNWQIYLQNNTKLFTCPADVRAVSC